MSDGVRIAIAVGVGLCVLLLTRSASAKGAPSGTGPAPSPDNSSGEPITNKLSEKWKNNLNDSKRAIIAIIEEEFRRAGLGERVIGAAITNAWVESGLNPNAVGDNGASIGLFQLHKFGAGHGLSVEYRKDPRNNTKTILEREVLAKRGNKLRTREKEGAGVGELAAIFSRDIERPKAVKYNMKLRKALAEEMFPTMVEEIPTAVA